MGDNGYAHGTTPVKPIPDNACTLSIHTHIYMHILYFFSFKLFICIGKLYMISN